MLQTIRDAITGWMAYAVILVLIVPFALWGIGDYLGVFGENYAVKVNDTEIPLSKFRDTYTRRYSSLRQQYGANFRAELIDEAALRQQVLDELVDEELLYQYATDRGLRISDAKLAREIHAVPAFQDAGVFSPERYRFLLQTSGLSPGMFEADLRRSMVLAQLESAIQGTSFLPTERFEQLIRIADQRREFAWAEIVSADHADPGAITDEQVAEYYEIQRARFMTMETLDIEYVDVTVDGIADGITVDEDALQVYYQERLATQVAQQERRVSHILLTTDARTDDEARALAESLRARLDAGETFEAIAAEHSDDPDTAGEGGDLGWVERGVFQGAFEDTLYALAEGEISQPIRTGFGWHLIRLDGVRSISEPLGTFEELRGELANEYRATEAERRYYSLVERLADLAFENPDSLDPAADALGISVHRVNGITRTAGAGIASDARVRNAAFATEVLEQGYNSGLVELGDNRVAVVRVAHREISRQLSLEEVEGTVRDNLVREAARARAVAVAEQMVTRAREGEELPALAEEFGAEWHEARSSGRSDVEVVPSLLDAVFQAPHPEVDGAPVIGSRRIGNDMAVFRLYDVTPGSPESMEAAQVEGVTRVLAQRQGSAEFTALLMTLKARARIAYGTNLFSEENL